MRIIDNVHGFFWESMTQNNCNTYFVDGPTRILVDPGHMNLFGHVEKGLEALNVGLEDIGLVLCTHAHQDHIEAAQVFSDLPAMTTIHEKDWQLVKTMIEHLGASSPLRTETVQPDFFLKGGEFTVEGLDFRVIHTPGHSPGGICLYWPEKKILFSGDLIFKEGLGRTDLPGGNGEELKASIKGLSDLEIEYILPGHGGIISGAKAVRQNFEQIENYWFGYV
jgi:hydroxyacylglutathione hydrolase